MSNSRDVIDARPETLGTLLSFSSTTETIVIPLYQRFYQWDVPKIIDLLRLTDPDSTDFGFIGTMVFVRDKKNRLEVVDGQQRLLSLLLILCALRDYINLRTHDNPEDGSEKLADLSRDIQKDNLLVSKTYSSEEDTPRIIFHRKSYVIFKNKFLRAKTGYVPEESVNSSELRALEKNY